MSNSNRFLQRVWLFLICATFATGTVFAQDDEREERDNAKTKQAQAVSKEVYDRIQRAQEHIDEEDEQGALRILTALENKKGITE